MADVEVSHREIYDRLLMVEQKVDQIEKNTEAVVAAFEAAQGAFKTLEFFGRLAKPLMLLGAAITLVGIYWQNIKDALR